MDLTRIGVLAHPNRSATAPVAERISASLRARGVETWLETEWVESGITDAIRSSSLIIAIGGDGAMLRAARAAARHGLPVLGINMGYLGFLTEVVSPDEWDRALDQLLDDRDVWVEQRMMIRVESSDIDGKTCVVSDALNDVVLSRGDVTRTVRLPTFIDGNWTTTYNADALIIATATGSTAYALASGGPILPPGLRNILVVPVAPHLSLDRPIILPDGAAVRVLVDSDARTQPILAVDGEKLCDLDANASVIVQASPLTARFIRLRDRNYFYRSLLDRLEPRVFPPK
jgi:NAD+ kinase